MVEALKPLTEPGGDAADAERDPGGPCAPQSRSSCRRRPSATAICSRWSTSAWPRNGASRRRWEECVRYGRSGAHWPAFPDTPGALAVSQAALQARHPVQCRQRELRLQQPELGVDFDAIYTAEDIGSYKPSLRISTTCSRARRLGIAKGDILHTAESMFHDHKPANDGRAASCWIYRRHADEGFGATMHPGDMPGYDFRFTSMGELAKAHQAEVKGRKTGGRKRQTCRLSFCATPTCSTSRPGRCATVPTWWSPTEKSPTSVEKLKAAAADATYDLLGRR